MSALSVKRKANIRAERKQHIKKISRYKLRTNSSFKKRTRCSTRIKDGKLILRVKVLHINKQHRMSRRSSSTNRSKKGTQYLSSNALLCKKIKSLKLIGSKLRRAS